MIARHLILLIVCAGSLLCCQRKQEKEKTVTTAVKDKTIKAPRPVIPYDSFTKKKKQEFAALRFQKDIAGLEQLLFETVALQMPAYWDGITWDFNGVSRIPGQGSIACGYFITTIMEDIGLTINRVRMAQQPSSELIRYACTQIKNYASFADLEKYIRNAPVNSVFIVGLDFHTGFIVKDNDSAYFFHSNYIRRSGVTKEWIGRSAALKASKSVMIGSLTANKNYLLQ